MEFRGYKTPCGVGIVLIEHVQGEPPENHSPWAWRVADESADGRLPGPLLSQASSTRRWHQGNVVIFAACDLEGCPKAPLYHRGPYEGRYHVYCQLERVAENSLRQIVGEDYIRYWSWRFNRFLQTGTEHCACVSQGEGGRPKIVYNPYNCKVFQPHGCTAEVCFITKKQRDPEEFQVVNVLADITYTENADGLFPQQKIVKGIKLEGPVVKHIAERMVKEMMKRYGDNPSHWGAYGRALRGQVPTRVYVARGTGKDLLQDLADAQEGLEVIHDSDLKKEAAAAKRERRTKYQEAKKRKYEKQNIANWLRVVNEGVCENGEPASDFMKQWAMKELEKRGINIEGKKPVQGVLFE